MIALEGELDLAGAAELERELAGVEASAVVIDLRELGFMDSSGLRALAVAAQQLQRAGRRLALVPGPPRSCGCSTSRACASGSSSSRIPGR